MNQVKIMSQEVNNVYSQVFTEKPRYLILMGGRGAGRSTVASQFANAKLGSPEYFRCAIMRQVLSDIRNSIYQEILDRAEENGVRDSLDVNDGLMTIEYGNNFIHAHGFRKSSGDRKAKLKSLANYNVVIIEEADEISEEDFMQLDDSIRTVKGDITIIFLLNCPPKSHWIISRFFDLLPSGIKDYFIPKLKEGLRNTIFIHTTFEDNIKNLAQQTIDNYREYEVTKPDHFHNMIQGLVPETARGKIYSGWRIIDEVPHEARLISYGLDYGYTNDPTAIVAIYYLNNAYIVDEIAYSLGLSNRQIADILTAKGMEAAPLFPDSAEPKSNAELRLYKLTVMNTTKGKGSVTQGVDFVKAQKISVTKRSVNIIKEYENYVWMIDKEGNSINEPKDLYNHAMDAIRYGFQIKGNLEPAKEYEQPPAETPGLSSPPSAMPEEQEDLPFIPKRRESNT